MESTTSATVAGASSQVATAVRELVRAGWLRRADRGYVVRGGDA